MSRLLKYVNEVTSSMNAILIYNELNLIFTRINIFPRFLYDLIYFTKSNLISGDSKTSQTVVKAS